MTVSVGSVASSAAPRRRGTAIAVPRGNRSDRQSNIDESHVNTATQDQAPSDETDGLPRDLSVAPAAEAAASPVPLSTPRVAVRVVEPRPLPKRTTPGASVGPRSTPSAGSMSTAPSTSTSTSTNSATRSYATSSPHVIRRPSGTAMPIGVGERIPSVGPPSLRAASNTSRFGLATERASVARTATDRGPSAVSNVPRQSGSASAALPHGVSFDKGKGRLMSTPLEPRPSAPPARMRVKPPRGSRPKAPPSAYVLFARQRRPAVEQSAATASGPRFNVNAALRTAWQALDKQVRQPFETEALRLRTAYEAAMDAFREVYDDDNDDNNDDDDDDGEHADGSGRVKSSSSIHRTAKGIRAQEAATKKAVGRPTKRVYQPGEPVPPKNAYFLFKQDYERRAAAGSRSSGAISTAWHGLSEEERAVYRSQAEEARRAYEVASVAWKQSTQTDVGGQPGFGEEGAHRASTIKAGGNPTGGKVPKRHTVSDDEAEYLAQVVEHGPSMASNRLDERSTAMAQLGELRFNQGRVSAKTFDVERKLRKEQRDRDNLRRRIRRNDVRTEAELTHALGDADVAKVDLAHRSASRRDSSLAGAQSDMSDAADEAATNDGHDASATEGDDAQSDAESVGAASTSTHHTLREKKYSVRTRIVDGRIVLDESSLQQSRNEEAGLGMRGELIDVNEADRFINSATHARTRVRNDRWTVSETTRFLEAVSMWGSDFEMIARMFPARNRQQIRAKWHGMERTDSHSLDLAFKRRLPVDLELYGRMTGVDLSGEAPLIEVRMPTVKKAGEDEEEAEDEDGGGDGDDGDDDDDDDHRHLKRGVGNMQRRSPVPQEREIERDENGLEIVDEGDDEQLPASVSQRVSKTGKKRGKAAAGKAAASTPSQQTSRASNAVPDQSGITTTASVAPSAPNVVGESQGTDMRQAGRASSRARSSSTATARPTGVAVAAVNVGASNGPIHAPPSAAASERQRKRRRQQDDSRKERELARRRPAPSGEEEIVED